MTSAAVPRWRRRKQARPGEIIDAALQVFSERGFAGARLDDIAARAGVSKGALYLYFATKEDLFHAVVAEAFAPNLAAVRQAAERFDGAFADLARLIIPNIARLAIDAGVGGVLKMVIGESRNFPTLAKVWHDALVAPALATVAGLIERAQSRGEIRPGDPRMYALGLIAPVVLGLIWRETFSTVGAPEFDLDALAHQHVETALAGMLAEAK